MEDWDQRYRDGDTPWDRGEAAPPLRQVLADWPREWWAGGPVLVPGCGRGFDAALLAERGLSVVGLDLSSHAVAAAEQTHGGGREDLKFVQGDLFDLSLAERLLVRVVWEHTCFCAIDPGQRAAYVQAMAGFLEVGERLMGVFYTDPDAEDGPPYAVSKEELADLFAPFFTWGRSEIPRECFSTREGCELLVEFVRRH